MPTDSLAKWKEKLVGLRSDLRGLEIAEDILRKAYVAQLASS